MPDLNCLPPPEQPNYKLPEQSNYKLPEQSNYKLPEPIEIKKDFNMLQDLRKAFNLPLLEKYPKQPFDKIKLRYGSKEYNMIYDKFSETAYDCEISQIVRIKNPFILLHYRIAKCKFLTHIDDLEEDYYFHGTWQENLTSISKFNFDRSKIVNHKFGKGISFANDSSYAADYPKDCMRFNRVMVVAKMFHSSWLEYGDKNTIVPEDPASYTTINKAGTVLVKYDDASYYPAYIIYYNEKYGDGDYYDYYY